MPRALLILFAPVVLLACSGGSSSPSAPPSPDASVEAGNPFPPPPPPLPDAGVHETSSAAEAGPDTSANNQDSGDASTLDASDGAPQGGIPVSTGGSDQFESEDQIAVAPDGTIGIAWTAFGGSAGTGILEYAFSTNGGSSFTPPAGLPLPAGLYAGDPAITTDAAGNFYLSTLGIHYTGRTLDFTRVLVAKAPKGTTTFDTPVEATDPSTTLFHDHPKLHVTAAGTIALSFMESQSLMANTTVGLVATSSDAVTWTRSMIVGQPDAEFVNLFSFCEAQGILYSTYLEATQTAVYIALRSSTDQGKTWSKSTPVSGPRETVAGLDPTCAASGDDVWVAYADTLMPSTSFMYLDPADAIEVAESTNRGSSFAAAPVSALDTAAAKLGLLPVMVRESTGALDVAYLAGNFDGDTAGSMRYVRATGTSFGSSVWVDGPLTYTLNRAMPTWVGDYLGAAVLGQGLYLAYPMNEAGSTHIYFRRMTL